MSLFESLNIATRGLAAAQLGISVTGQNITNAKDETYSRKRIEQSAEWRKDGSYGQMGFGVEVYSINRVRDQFIDRLVNEESTRYGHYSIKDASYTRIESIFCEPSEHALNSLLNNFWNNWADVANNPESAGARETLRSNAQSLVSQFHYITTQLRSYKDTINDEIESRVDRINEITANIYRCNTVISATENTLGNKANDTRDQRDALLNELAQLTDVDYFEDDRGAFIISTNGNMLVSNAKNHELVTRRTELTEKNGYQYSRVEVSFELTGNVFCPKQGELRALMDVRDVDIPKYEEYINDLAKSLVIEVNKIHQNGYALSGLTFIDFFDSDPDKLNSANIDISQAIKNDLNNVAAGSGGKKKSIDDSLKYDNQTVRSDYTNLTNIRLYDKYDTSTLRIFDNSTVPPTLLVAGTDYDIGTGPDRLLTFDPSIIGPITIETTYNNSTYVVPHLEPGAVAYDVLDLKSINENYRFIYKNSLEISVLDDYGNKVPLQEGKDYDIDYNTGIITFKYSATNAFAGLGTQVYINFDYHETGYAGPGDGSNALLLSQLRDKAIMQSDVFGNSTQTVNQFYSGMLGRLGTERNEAAAGLDTRTAAMAQLKGYQKEISGVDLNEEMANLILYEHTYQASARYLSTVSNMLDILLNM
jgi:flagellar hook-associated protein 1 FlgK